MDNCVLSSLESVADLDYGETSWAVLLQILSPFLNLVEWAVVTIGVQGTRRFELEKCCTGCLYGDVE